MLLLLKIDVSQIFRFVMYSTGTINNLIIYHHILSSYDGDPKSNKDELPIAVCKLTTYNKYLTCIVLIVRSLKLIVRIF